MFVKASSKPYVKPAVAVEDEMTLLETCGNRTARRSVKKLKIDEQESVAETNVVIIEETVVKSIESKDKKKKTKTKKKEKKEKSKKSKKKDKR